MLTFRLVDSLPAERLAGWREESRRTPMDRGQAELRERIEGYLDAGHGDAVLRQTRVAGIVQSALLHFDGIRYRLHAWVIMPNHVHVLITPFPRYGLTSTVHAWKSFTAKAVNRLLGRQGRFWQPDYFDRYIRDDYHFGAAVEYIEENPVAAGLCASRDEWVFSSAYFKAMHHDAGETPALPGNGM